MALTLSVIAACSLVKPVEEPADRASQAAQLAADGNHAAAARAYDRLAQADAANHDSYELLSAEQWIAAGDVVAAKSSFNAVSAEARTEQPASRALVAAEIALAENDGVSAIHELDTIPIPESRDLAQNYWYIRGNAALLTGHPVEGIKAFVERERYLPDAAALRASRDELFAKIRTAAEHGATLQVPPKSDPIVAGWLQLGPIAVALERDQAQGAEELARWRRLHPQHPGYDSALAPSPETSAAIAGQASTTHPSAAQANPSVQENPLSTARVFPGQIALLLPLSGRAEAVGVAVRDGFISAYLAHAAAARPSLRVYDVSSETVAGAFQHAVQDGANFVVGPLTKEDVAALVPLCTGRVPVLALNFLADSLDTPRDFYQFALWPEDEARSVARRLAADGKTMGVLILPEGELGNRVGAAFAEEFNRLGGTVLDSGKYDAGRADFSAVIKQTLQVHGAKGEPTTHRGDAAFVFVVGSPSAERLLISQLKFHFAGDVPAYSLSDSFEPNPSANADLDGLVFPDMPWMVSSDPNVQHIRDDVRGAWPTRTARLDRLYAFGFDAYGLLPDLLAHTLNDAAAYAGVTGRLRLDSHNKVRRDFDWSQIRSGSPAPIPPVL